MPYSVKTMQTTQSVLIVSAVRTAVGKAGRGTLKNTRPDELAAATLRCAVERLPQFDLETIDDVIIGCATHEGPQGYNVARIASLRAGFPVSVPAMTINRFCASGLETIAMGAERILSGRAEVVIAGGVESMSQVPFGVNLSPNPTLMEHAPDAYLSMGLTAENLARKYSISRRDQDAYAYQSHQKAIAAIDAGKFREEILPIKIDETHLNTDGAPETVSSIFDTDEGPRRDTSLEALAIPETCLSYQRHSNSWQRLSDERRCRRCCPDVRGTSERRRLRTNGTFCQLRHSRCPSRNHGNWTGACHSESTRVSRVNFERYRHHRTQRSLCRTGARCHSRDATTY